MVFNYRLINSKITATFNAPTGTENGSLHYVKAGKMVNFSGSMQVTAALNTVTLFSGMPIPNGGLASFRCMCSSTGNYYDFYINSDGTIRTLGAWSATGWYRFAGAYITA